GIAIAKRKPLVAKNIPGTYIKGRTREGLQVVYKGNSSLIGEVLNVKISGVEENTLIGDIV
ncbi:MAG: TRAM domain-containing protein, partial [Candidatus Orphnella occulta]|nr:TRAM domain-containing protein [Candidatus Orphnella occulta]